ncbi:hypothetical protein R1sor_003920 [Riccia sorocarpa]|uniref:J domain-containing protein n=1 Tax=Riccia sorocarpa TaxID=122646 RepID=A0ABD3H3S5_9MARC
MAVFRVWSHRWPAVSSLRLAAASTVRPRKHGAQGRTLCRSLNLNSSLSSQSTVGRVNRGWKFPVNVTSRSSVGRTFSTRAAASEWKEEQSPYDTLGIARDVDEDEVKAAYRKMAKQFHPDVYDDSKELLEEGETAESKFIRIQAAYELLMDRDQRRQYDLDHRVNPMQASRAWMDWVMKKKKAFEQRGDMAASVWAEQQQREMSLKARRLSRHKVDPEEERRILAKERQASQKNFETTINRHALILKKRELNRRRADEEAKKKLVQQLLAAEGLELEDEKL